MLKLDSHDIKLITDMLDALECAKEVLALMPQLPTNMKPVYFRILNTIYRIDAATGSSRVSDISRVLGFLLPNTTKLINEMVELNIVEKIASASDKRVVLVRVTEVGEQYIHKYVLRFIEDSDEEFSKIDESDCITMIETIQKVYQAMKKVYQDNAN